MHNIITLDGHLRTTHLLVPIHRKPLLMPHLPRYCMLRQSNIYLEGLRMPHQGPVRPRNQTEQQSLPYSLHLYHWPKSSDNANVILYQNLKSTCILWGGWAKTNFSTVNMQNKCVYIAVAQVIPTRFRHIETKCRWNLKETNTWILIFYMTKRHKHLIRKINYTVQLYKKSIVTNINPDNMILYILFTLSALVVYKKTYYLLIQ